MPPRALIKKVKTIDKNNDKNQNDLEVGKNRV